MGPSQSRDTRIQSCGLLSSLDLPLDKIISHPHILDNLYSFIMGDDLLLAAEAASTFRTWTMDSKNTRILYANCFFPKFLGLLPSLIGRINLISSLSLGDVELLEHSLVSCLLTLWAVIEEIPAALPQVNKSCIMDLLIAAWERSMLLKPETTLVTLQVALTTIEDNLSILTPVQSARMSSLLEQQQSVEGHVGLLAKALLSQLQEQDLDAQYLLALDCKGNLEMMRDVLEFLANSASSFARLGDKGIVAFQERIACLPTDKTVLEGNVVAKECWQRVFGCLNNVLMNENGHLISTTVRHQIWTWTIRDVFSSGFPICESQAELMRNICLLSLNDTPLPYEATDDALVRQVIESNLANDPVLSCIASLPAILFNESFSQADWLNNLLSVLFTPERPMAIILATAEILEDLLKRNILLPATTSVILANRNAVYSELDKYIRSLSSRDEREGRKEELEYIKSILSALRQ